MSRPLDKPRWMDKKAIRKLEEDIWKKTMTLAASYLMDEFNYNEDAICDFWDGMNKYVEAIGDKLITVNKVQAIIYEHTGIKIK